MEEWRDIKGYEGMYQVSNEGRVKSLNYKRGNAAKIMKPELTISGYYQISLYCGGKRGRHYVHRLVAEAFIPNPENKPVVDHINTIRIENSVCNLRWATTKENVNNAISHEKLVKTMSTDEYKNKISNANKGKKRTPEQNEANRQRQLGKKLSDECRRKISEANKGRVISEESRMKISEANKGHKMPEELKKKLIEMHKGIAAYNRRKCVQLTLDDEFVAFHPCLSVDGFDCGKISECCSGKRKSHRRFKWMYEEDYIKMLEDIASQQLN